METTGWVVDCPNGPIGPFKDAGEAGKWLSTFANSVRGPHTIRRLIKPWPMDRNVVDAAKYSVGEPGDQWIGG